MGFSFLRGKSLPSPEPTCPLSFPTSTVLWERAGAELSGGEALAKPNGKKSGPGNLEFIQQQRRDLHLPWEEGRAAFSDSSEATRDYEIDQARPKGSWIDLRSFTLRSFFDLGFSLAFGFSLDARLKVLDPWVSSLKERKGPWIDPSGLSKWTRIVPREGMESTLDRWRRQGGWE